MNRIDDMVYTAEDIKAWMKKNKRLIGAGIIALGSGVLAYRLGLPVAEEHYIRFINDHVIKEAGKKGGQAFYEWMADNVPKAADLCDEFVDSNPDASKVSDYFMKHNYTIIMTDKLV